MSQDREVGMIKRFNALFAKVDTDGSNSIQLEELEALFQSEGYKLSRAQIEKIYRIIDNNGDGKLSRPEFTRMMYVLENSQPDDVEKVEFLVADADYSGALDANELLRVCKRLGHEQKREAVEAALEEITGKKEGPLELAQYDAFLKKVGMK